MSGWLTPVGDELKNCYKTEHRDEMGISDVHIYPQMQNPEVFKIGEHPDIFVYALEDALVTVTNEELVNAKDSRVVKGIVTITAVLKYNGSLEEYNNGSKDPKAGLRPIENSLFHKPKNGIRVIRMKGSKPNVES